MQKKVKWLYKVELQRLPDVQLFWLNCIINNLKNFTITEKCKISNQLFVEAEKEEVQNFCKWVVVE